MLTNFTSFVNRISGKSLSSAYAISSSGTSNLSGTNSIHKPAAPESISCFKMLETHPIDHESLRLLLV